MTSRSERPTLAELALMRLGASENEARAIRAEGPRAVRDMVARLREDPRGTLRAILRGLVAP